MGYKSTLSIGRTSDFFQKCPVEIKINLLAKYGHTKFHITNTHNKFETKQTDSSKIKKMY